MSKREDFEAQVLSKYPNQDMGRFSDGEYKSVMVQHCWEFWQARAARTAPAEGIAIGRLSREAGSERIVLDPIGDPHIKDGMVVYTAPDALQAEVEQLKNALEVEKRSLQCEVNRRNQYAMESGELDRQVEALKNSNKGCEDCFIEMRAERDALKAALSSIADYVADNWPMKNYNLQEIEDRLRAIDAARTAKPEVDHE